ncbi:MAG TPA: hydrogenase formation protein HypD [Kiritimatiellia bacterium]|nr:hydrogenase formation protein HypD [Kiritimatiellia bacterium]
MTALPSVSELAGLAARLGRRIQLMEVCGTHTMSAFRSGLRSLLPENVALLSGPGCPVCVTPNHFIDRAVQLATAPDTVVTTFGDMMRVPGSHASLEKARAQGAAVKVVYSPLDALEEARRHPELKVVFLGVGFETTAPTTAWAVQEARRSVPNFSVLCAHKTMPEAMAALLRSGEVRIDGFLCPGHVSVVIGAGAYRGLVEEFGIPCVITGFEGGDMVRGIEMALRQVVEGRAEVEIQYTRSVTWEGNARARAALADVFEEDDAEWRGLGMIPRSGLKIRHAYAGQDADRVFAAVPRQPPVEPAGCRCGDVLRGAIAPPQCPLFRKICTPANPVGACMVSSEGTCAAYYKYQ